MKGAKRQMIQTTKNTKGHEKDPGRGSPAFVFFVSFVVPKWSACGAQRSAG